MINVQNPDSLSEELAKLSQHDRQEIETFIGYLKSRPKTVLPKTAPVLTQKLNVEALKGYVEESIDFMEVVENEDFGFEELKIYFINRNRPVSFDLEWFHLDKTGEPLVFKLADNDGKLFVKHRLGSNRIDRVAIDKKYISSIGLSEPRAKKKILVLEEIKNVAVPLTAAVLNVNPSTSWTLGGQNITVDKTHQTASQFVTQLINQPKTTDLITASASKAHSMFNDVSSFTNGKPKLDRVATILVNFIDEIGENSYSWDSEFFYGQRFDFTNVKVSNKFYGKKIDVKAHFRKNDCLQISEFSLKSIDADYILSVLVEETDTEYKATVCGYISKTDFVNKTKPFNYNDKVVLLSMELNELNDAKELFE